MEFDACNIDIYDDSKANSHIYHELHIQHPKLNAWAGIYGDRPFGALFTRKSYWKNVPAIVTH